MTNTNSIGEALKNGEGEVVKYFSSPLLSSRSDIVSHAFFTKLEIKNAYLDNIKILKQIHSNKVVVLNHSEEYTDGIEADALVTQVPGIAIGIKTADCVPILLLDYDASIIGAAHAGWKGAFSGIIDNVIDVMISLGAKRSSMIAAIGPCIQQKNYEIGQDFYQNFKQSKIDCSQFIKIIDERSFFDLPEYCNKILESNELAQIDNIKLDTYSNPDLFYSYRRFTHEGAKDLTKKGNQISAIALV